MSKEYFIRICDGFPRLVAEAPDAGRADMLERALKDAVEDGIEGKTASRAVIVVEVLEKHRQLTNRGKICDVLEVHQQFQNALDASQALGLKGNQVSNYLSQANRQGELRAEVRGVVLMYLDNFISD